MRDMKESDTKLTLRYQAAAIARDVMTIAAVVGLLSSAFWVVARPYLVPYLELPQQIAEFRRDIAKMQLQLAEIRVPRIVDFDGLGQIIDGEDVRPGGTITVLFSLRRNASCATDIDVYFFDVNKGSKFFSHTMRSVQAPVSNEYDLYLYRIRVPGDTPPGQYIYYPRINPVECGVYGPYNGAATTPFTVREREG